MDYHISTAWVIVLTVLALWEAVWKGLALWHAAQHKQTGWFVAILVVNSVGILPIVYLMMNKERAPRGHQEAAA